MGRNYADHAAELNNPITGRPLLFIKPPSAVTPFEDSLMLAGRRGTHHYETEMALLIGSTLHRAGEAEVPGAIAGIGIGLDLTLRELQSELKAAGHPWERAKAFDGSCALSRFVVPPAHIDWDNIDIALEKNGARVQHGNTGQMLFPVISLLCEISGHFTLEPGDVVMTGTPAGVGELHHGDHLKAELSTLVSAQATVVVADD